MKKACFIVDDEFEGTRLDVFITEMMEDLSRSYIQKLIGEGHITVNKILEKNKYLVKEGDIIDAILPAAQRLSTKPENIPLEIVYEDKHLLVVNKPQDMVVHPGSGNDSGTLVNALLYHCKGNLSSINGVIRPGIVHRIDKDTSGLLVVAKDDLTHQGLASQLAEHSMLRSYEAVTTGRILEDRLKIDAPIGRHPQQRLKMAVNLNGKNAITHIRVIRRFDNHTHIEANLETGRTHQIRVHLAYINHPILGDERYGGFQKSFNTKGQVLHAKSLGFVHPISNNSLFFEAPLPTLFINVLHQLQEKSGSKC